METISVSQLKNLLIEAGTKIISAMESIKEVCANLDTKILIGEISRPEVQTPAKKKLGRKPTKKVKRVVAKKVTEKKPRKQRSDKGRKRGEVEDVQQMVTTNEVPPDIMNTTVDFSNAPGITQTVPDENLPDMD